MFECLIFLSSIISVIILFVYLKSQSISLSTLVNSFSKFENSLANPKIRGAWGEVILEDLLEKFNMVEGVNYVKQKTMDGKRPDITLNLPNGLKCNVDSKFPLNNYLNYINSGDKSYLEKFIKDIKLRIKEVTDKEYINENTVDFAIVFIPNDQVLKVALDNDPTFFDYCTSLHVCVVSPWSLFIVLSLIKYFSYLLKLDANKIEILNSIQATSKELDKMNEAQLKVEKRLNDLNTDIEALHGTRTKALKRVAAKINVV